MSINDITNSLYNILFLISWLNFFTPIQFCNCEWTSGGMVTASFSHHEENSETYTTAYLNITYRDKNTYRVYLEKSEIAKFGGAHVYPAQGVLVHVTSAKGDHTGCSLPFKSSSVLYNYSLPLTEPWIALVKRGGCNFQVKVENAFRSNATGVIVYNDRDKHSLEKMKLSPVGNTGNFSAVFTYKWKGEELAHLIDNGTKVYAQITIASHYTRPFNTINRTSVLFVSISFIILMIISLSWLVFYYVQRFRYINAKDRLSRRLCTAAKKALSKIPTKHIKAEDKEIQGDGECCAVCIEPYKASDVVRILPCKHEFHRSCIDPWLLEHRTCPMCKMDILKHYGFVQNRPAFRLVTLRNIINQSDRAESSTYVTLGESNNNTQLLSIMARNDTTLFAGSQESILHMDIDEAISDADSVHHTNNIGQVPNSVVQRGLHNLGGLSNEMPDLITRSTTPDPRQSYYSSSAASNIAYFPCRSQPSDFSKPNSSSSRLRPCISLDDLPSQSRRSDL